MSKLNRVYMLIGAVALVAIAATAVTLTARSTIAGGDDNEQAITGTALEQASAAALAHTGGGRVTETEAGDEESYYEVEVTLDDGSQVDVQLDEHFDVVGDEADDESGNDDAGGADDD